ncbi:MAG: glycosyl hydrolase [Deltaproteobacteria bacterium]|nr:glycosyl hydrolase [Deltaproteobacteria bacterium]
MRNFWLPLALLGSGLACATATPDPLFDSFVDPAKDTRPFVRWWWNGGRVEPGEIKRELDVLDAAGIGGVEINTIAHPGNANDVALAKFPAVDWLSPEWNHAVRTAATHAHARGMTADLIVGSGWPFGGRFLAPEEQIQRVFVAHRMVEGPVTFEITLKTLAEDPSEGARQRKNREEQIAPTARKLVALYLAPDGSMEAARPAPSLPLSEGDTISLSIPVGKHLVTAIIWEAGFSHVKLGAPGADGPVVDHFNAAAVRKYLDQMSTRLAPSLDGRLGNFIRATFVDSLELDHSNWTGDLLSEFQSRRGYDLMPFLRMILDKEDPTASSPDRDTIRRARYDYLSTLVELFEERFVRTYTRWADDNGVKARIQAYGRETHPLHGSMEVHLPEGETWLWVDKQHEERIRVDATVVNKYVSSAANLTGQRLRSFEAMTNAVPVFRETLQDFKRGMDATLIAGLNHPIIHGFNYTPLQAGFPGWVRFGCYLNERNPWWPQFRHFSNYAARLGTIMRASVAQAKIAVLAPRAEELQLYGLLYQPFPEVQHPWYQYKLVEAIHKNGHGADFVSERILQKAHYEKGQMHYGPRAYDLLVVEDVAAMEPATAASLQRFAESGGQIVFVGATPSRYSGLADREKQDRLVKERFAATIKAAGARANTLVPPTEANLLEWTASMLAASRLVPSVEMKPAHDFVSQVHQTVHEASGDRDIVYFANTSTEEGATFSARFPSLRGSPWRWDPETGTRSPVAGWNPAEGLKLYLAPMASLLLVFEPEARHLALEADNAQPLSSEAPLPGNPREIVGPWQVELQTVNNGPRITRERVALGDLSLAEDDPVASGFGGIAVYRTTFVNDGSANLLDLGVVHSSSEVFINGKSAGVRWWGQHRYDLTGLLLPGKNALEIRVTTVLVNYMKAQKDNPEAQRWSWWAKPIPMGLVGPVRIDHRPSGGR